MDQQRIRIKVCGMSDPKNIRDVEALRPDYIGFIFYDKSPRYVDHDLPKTLPSVQRVGVFVDATVEECLDKTKTYDLDVLQLHGNESPQFCTILREKILKTIPEKDMELWKVFGIKDTFDFSILENYETSIDKFLFDTKGKAKGGNGYTFDWSVLKHYPSRKPIILSGGIGPEEINAVEQILKTDLPIYALDLNSKFEIQPGLKDSQKLERFMSIRTLAAN